MLRLCGVVLGLSLVAPAGPAMAATSQGEATAAAQALYDQGRTLLDQGKNEKACALLEESQRLDPAAGTQFWLATCYSRIDKLASAWALFVDVAAQEHAKGGKDREALARQRAEEVKRKVPSLTIQVTEPIPSGLELRRNGTVVREAQIGVPIPVDAGPQEIVASAPGRKPFELRVEVVSGSGITTVVIPSLDPGASDSPAETAKATVPSEGPSPEHRPEASKRRSFVSPWLFLEGVAGVGPGQLSVNYGGYNLSQGYGLADIGLALGGGVALGPGVTLGARVRYDHVIAFGGLTGDANLWGISPTVGYRFTHSEGRYSYLQGGVGAEHSPKVGTVSLIVHLDYTFVAGHFLIGPGIDFLTNTQNGVKEEDFLFSLRVGYSAFR